MVAVVVDVMDVVVVAAAVVVTVVVLASFTPSATHTYLELAGASAFGSPSSCPT